MTNGEGKSWLRSTELFTELLPSNHSFSHTYRINNPYFQHKNIIPTKMTESPPIAPNTMATSETGIETPVQRQSEGIYCPSSLEPKDDPLFWLLLIVFCGTIYGFATLEEDLRPHFELYVAGLGEGRTALTNLCYVAYYTAIFVSWIICTFMACGLVVVLPLLLVARWRARRSRRSC